eukprot:TRINITY_DN3784_c0_g1_i1.p2 TRINITY_DN3784_c0_g1~~TRINITY_DN3784_c0_g1_i1.p2  ORF type:complete len:193 (-),score=23.27 TRINITY_DN3784_c0_g1_i1:246-764(-)
MFKEIEMQHFKKKKKNKTSKTHPKMIVPKEDRKKVYRYLLQEGVLYAKKDYAQEKHEEVDTRNLYVIKLMQSFTSRELVKEQFAWRHYYWFLTEEGLQYLREYLGVPSEVVPNTHKKPERPAERRQEQRPRRDRYEGPREGGYRDTYRTGEGRGFGRGAGKMGQAPGDYTPQ